MRQILVLLFFIEGKTIFLFYYAEPPAACCEDEDERTLRSISFVGLVATKNFADTSQLTARSFISSTKRRFRLFCPVKRASLATGQAHANITI